MWFSSRIQHTALPSSHDRKMVPVFREGGISGALLTDLSKAFDCLLHDLLIAKLTAYGFDYDPLVFIQSYFPERQQRTKVNNTYSTYSYIIWCSTRFYTKPNTFILVICFTILIIAILPAMLKTTHHTLVILTYKK